MIIDIIICTYNRQKKVAELVYQLNNYSSVFNSIIVVDSSDILHPKLIGNNLLLYIHSPHKNQPYQRYLGYINSNADILIFLDDDMELLDSKIFKQLIETFSAENIIGINLSFDNHNQFLSSQPNGLINEKFKFKNLFAKLSGYPIAKPNQYLYCGIRGERVSNKPIEFLSGGAFAVKRDKLYKNFNWQLFDIYEKNMGKGEDGILGYCLSKSGTIYALEGLYFRHNDFKDSTYSINHKSFATKVMYSRLYLSLEYYRLNNAGIMKGWMRFHHYALGRIIGTSILYCIKPNTVVKDILVGYINGYLKAFFFKFKYIQNFSGNY